VQHRRPSANASISSSDPIISHGVKELVFIIDEWLIHKSIFVFTLSNEASANQA